MDGSVGLRQLLGAWCTALLPGWAFVVSWVTAGCAGCAMGEFAALGCTEAWGRQAAGGWAGERGAGCRKWEWYETEHRETECARVLILARQAGRQAGCAGGLGPATECKQQEMRAAAASCKEPEELSMGSAVASADLPCLLFVLKRPSTQSTARGHLFVLSVFTDPWVSPYQLNTTRAYGNGLRSSQTAHHATWFKSKHRHAPAKLGGLAFHPKHSRCCGEPQTVAPHSCCTSVLHNTWPAHVCLSHWHPAPSRPHVSPVPVAPSPSAIPLLLPSCAPQPSVSQPAPHPFPAPSLPSAPFRAMTLFLCRISHEDALGLCTQPLLTPPGRPGPMQVRPGAPAA